MTDIGSTHRVGRGGFAAAVIALLGGSAPLPAQAAPEWRLAAPEFEVGGTAAEADYELAHLGGVTILPDGSVVIGDRVAPFLKVFDARGVLLRDLGAFGEGPGEYEYVYDMDWCTAGELSVRDVDHRVHRYDEQMTFLSTDLVSLSAIGGGTPYKGDCHPNGLRIATGWGDFLGQFEPGLFEATAPVVLLRGDEVVRDFGVRLSSIRIGTTGPDGAPSGSGPHPFGRATVVALGSERVYIGAGERYEVEVYDLTGAPLPPLRWEGPSLEYDDDLVDLLEERALSTASERSRRMLRRWYAELPELDQLPAYDRILVSDTEEVWIREFARPGAGGEEWVVFGVDHALVGRLSLPPRSTLWEVRGDRAVYSVLDEFDVPIVRISRIER